MGAKEFDNRKNGKFPYDLSTMEFTLRMNDALSSVETGLMNYSLEETYPNIFIIGLSRSGTTLLSQVLFNCLDIACSNNLMAKFWKAPLTGAHLSKMILNNEKSLSYESVYGRTKDVSAPHEMGWFWNNIFNLDPLKPDYSKSSSEIDWQYIRSLFINISHILAKPVLYKPAESAVNRLVDFNKCFERPLFIVIERNITDVAASLAKARIDYYGNIDISWFTPSFWHEEYKALENQPYEIQIAGQIFYFLALCEEKLSAIQKERVLKIKYEDLCANPQGVIDSIRKKLRENYNYNIEQVPPSTLKNISSFNRLRHSEQNFIRITHLLQTTTLI